MYLNNIPKSLFAHIIGATLMLSLFLVSLFLYIITNRDRERVLFYFPDEISQSLSGEYRIIKRREELTKRISLYLQEYILGTSRIDSQNILDRSTNINALFYIRKTREVVINLDSDFFNRQQESKLDFNQVFEIIRDGIIVNFPRVHVVRFLIDGQEVFRG